MTFKPYGYDFDDEGKIVGYKGHKVLGMMTCPKHGKYPSLYVRPDGGYEPINGKECPYCNAQKVFESALKTAMVPKRYATKTVDNYEATKDWQIFAKKRLVEYCNNIDESVRLGRNIVILGGVGTGKTHLAIGILRSVIQNGGSGFFASVTDLVMDVRESWGKGNVKEVFDLYTNCDLLVLDEIGVQTGTDNERQILFKVINDRYNEMRPTVLLSNLNAEGFKSFVGTRVFDRLKENDGISLILNGESYRG